MAKQINAQAYITDSDLKTQCPSCYQDNTVRVGNINAKGGVNLPVYKCNGCNTAYLKPAEGGLQVLVDAVAAEYDGEASFSALDTTTSDGTGMTHVSGGMIDLDYDSKSKLDMIANNVSNLENTVRMLTDELRTIAHTNADLIEKLATDPLIETKKRVNKFNLE